MPHVNAVHLMTAIEQVFLQAGVPAADAHLVAEHLVDAEAAGVSSHGVMRVSQYLKGIKSGSIVVGAQAQVLSETVSTAVLEGGRGLGIVMARKVMEVAIAKARATGCGIASMRRCGHSGRLGAYTAYAATQGMAGMMLVNGGGLGQWMAPHGGRSGRLATNPLSVGVPAGDEQHLVIDLATSVAPEGKVRSEILAGRSIPPGWVIDAKGAPSTNPQDLYGPPQGALLPFGGHKGFALAMAVDALAGGLSGAGCCTHPPTPGEPGGDGILAIAIQVAAFAPQEQFGEQVAGLMRHVRSCPAIPGQQVQVPGDPERRQSTVSATTGIRLHDVLWASLEEAATSVGAAWNPPLIAS